MVYFSNESIAWMSFTCRRWLWSRRDCGRRSSCLSGRWQLIHKRERTRLGTFTRNCSNTLSQRIWSFMCWWLVRWSWCDARRRSLSGRTGRSGIHSCRCFISWLRGCSLSIWQYWRRRRRGLGTCWCSQVYLFTLFGVADERGLKTRIWLFKPFVRDFCFDFYGDSF